LFCLVLCIRENFEIVTHSQVETRNFISLLLVKKAKTIYLDIEHEGFGLA